MRKIRLPKVSVMTKRVGKRILWLTITLYYCFFWVIICHLIELKINII